MNGGKAEETAETARPSAALSSSSSSSASLPNASPPPSAPSCLPLHVNTTRHRVTGDSPVTLLPDGVEVPCSFLVGPTCTDGEVTTITPVRKKWVMVKRPSTTTNTATLDREPLTEEGAESRENEGEDEDDDFDRIDSRDEENMEEEEGYSPSDAGQTQVHAQGGSSSSPSSNSLSPMGVFKAVRDTKHPPQAASPIPQPSPITMLAAVIVEKKKEKGKEMQEEKGKKKEIEKETKRPVECNSTLSLAVPSPAAPTLSPPSSSLTSKNKAANNTLECTAAKTSAELPVAVAVGSRWGKHILRPVKVGSERNKAAVLDPDEQSGGGGGGGGSVAERIEGIPTAAVSLSRLFFENKVKEIAASLPNSPRNSLLLPRKWGYSPYASSSLIVRCIDSKVNGSPSPSSTAASQSQAESQSADARGNNYGGVDSDGMEKRRGRGREGESDVLGAKDFAERKAFFQDQILEKAAASPPKNYTFTSQFCGSPGTASPAKLKLKSKSDLGLGLVADVDRDRERGRERDGMCMKRADSRSVSVRDMVYSLQMQRRTVTG